MSARSPPFFDPGSNELDTDRVWEEVMPVLGLVVRIAVIAAIPAVLGVFAADPFSTFVFTLVAQVVVATGAVILVIYAVARGIQLSGRPHSGERPGPTDGGGRGDRVGAGERERGDEMDSTEDEGREDSSSSDGGNTTRESDEEDTGRGEPDDGDGP